jgi:hypothetical protein
MEERIAYHGVRSFATRREHLKSEATKNVSLSSTDSFGPLKGFVQLKGSRDYVEKVIHLEFNHKMFDRVAESIHRVYGGKISSCGTTNDVKSWGDLSLAKFIFLCKLYLYLQIAFILGIQRGRIKELTFCVPTMLYAISRFIVKEVVIEGMSGTIYKIRWDIRLNLNIPQLGLNCDVGMSSKDVSYVLDNLSSFINSESLKFNKIFVNCGIKFISGMHS